MDYYYDKERFIIIEGPTGVGKSAISVTLAKWAYSQENVRSYILTSQKILQDQYVADFPVLDDIRSSSNYQCTWQEEETCAEVSRLKKNEKVISFFEEISCLRGNCVYYNEKKKFIEGNYGVTNYSYFLSETEYAGGLTNRGLLILDEAHNLENELRKWATITIRQEVVENELKILYPKDLDLDKITTWFIENYKPAIRLKISEILDQLNQAVQRKNVKQIKILTHKNEIWDKHECQVNRFLLDKATTKDNFVVNVKDDNTEFEVKPLYLEKQAKDLLYEKAPKKVMLSSTILDLKAFKKSAGIPEHEPVAFLKLDSPFKSKAYGLRYVPVGKMSSESIVQTTPKLIDKIKSILEKHKDEKGIIHSVNYKITKNIEDAFNDARLLIQANADQRNELIECHKQSPYNTVLVSPSMFEGLDLYDDLGRFQIICKVPYPYLGDVVVKEKSKRDYSWYDWCTVRMMIQTVGRCVRNEKDWVHTYILDECFEKLYLKNKDMFPSYFKITILE